MTVDVAAPTWCISTSKMSVCLKISSSVRLVKGTCYSTFNYFTDINREQNIQNHFRYVIINTSFVLI